MLFVILSLTNLQLQNSTCEIIYLTLYLSSLPFTTSMPNKSYRALVDISARHKRRWRSSNDCLPCSKAINGNLGINLDSRVCTGEINEVAVISSSELKSSSNFSAEDAQNNDPILLNGGDEIVTSDTTSETSVEEEVDSVDSLIGELAQWAVSGISHEKVNDLLKILRHHKCLSGLPSDIRTLVKTPRSCELKTIGKGQYCHVGIKDSLKYIFENYPEIQAKLKLSLHCSVDGAPVANSSSSQIWPIQMSLADYPQISPFLVGIYHGFEKPQTCDDFLADYVEEMTSLVNHGLCHNGVRYSVSVDAYICDAPARAFLAQIKGHTGYFGCGKCSIEGNYVDGRVVFDEVGAPRTDETFASRVQEEHHVGDSPLERIPGTRMVTHFPYEYMHLACLGVMRKILFALVKGNLKIRLSRQRIEQINGRLEDISKYLPNEFQRKSRSLKYLMRWKATEFRQVLLYSGPYLFQGILPKDIMDHFLCFHFAMRIFVSHKYCGDGNMRTYAGNLLNYFVSHFGSIYGHESVSYNVHGLLHLAGDVKEYGTLDKFSAFKFENQLQILKKSIRSHRSPLQQVVRRALESRNVLAGTNPDFKKGGFHFSKITNFPLGAAQPAYRDYSLGCGKISTVIPDNCVVITNGDLMAVKFIATHEAQVVVIGQTYLHSSNFYSTPADSTDVGLHLMSACMSDLVMLPVTEITGKAIRIPNTLPGMGNGFYVAEILHC